MRRVQRTISISLAVAIATASAGCTTNPFTGEKQVSKTATGAGVGGAVGAAIGALSSRNRAKGAAIGAGVGVIAGGAVGAYMDRQEALLRERLRASGVSVTRVGDELTLNMPGNITFQTGSAGIKADFYPVLDSVAEVLREYRKTLIEIMGHTDSTGSEASNLELSRQRAASVSGYLRSRGVITERILTAGFGEQYPIASNDTAEGRQANRRVELRLVPITDS